MNPFASIVIVNYNYGRFLESAIKSVISQDGFGLCELIIVDGGSADNSVEIIRKYADKIAWWCSEKDNGQSDAFNKGFAHARGRLGCWVNADDLLLPGTLRAVISYIESHPNVEWVTGGTIFFNENNKIWRARIGTSITKRMHKWVDATVIGGPSSFFSLSRLREVGGFDISLHYTMDGDLWNKFFFAGMTMHHLPMYFWGFRSHAASKTSHAFTGKHVKAFQDEDRIVFRRKHYSAWEQKLRIVRLKIHKILTGSIFRSYIDTKKYLGADVIKAFSLQGDNHAN